MGTQTYRLTWLSLRRRKLNERRKCDQPINDRWDNEIRTLLIADDRLVVDKKKTLTFIHFRSSLFILHVWNRLACANQKAIQFENAFEWRFGASRKLKAKLKIQRNKQKTCWHRPSECGQWARRRMPIKLATQFICRNVEIGWTLKWNGRSNND